MNFSRPATPLRRALAALLALSLASGAPLRANPQGGQVRQGQVRIQQTPGHTRVLQSSQRAVIDWQSFSIERGETTRFNQPNSQAAALNRVRGPEASRIEGALRANGQVYLINPNGILVGPGGTIDVGGFVASTLDVGDRAFMRGGDLRFSGNSAAAVVNLGAISALEGDVVLIGASVLNAGSIRAPRGTAALAAGNDVLLAESGEERVFVRGGAGSATNTGSIEANVAELKAHGGNVYGMAVKNEGRVAATGVTRRGGQVFLSAKGGRVSSTGTLRAKASNGAGGRIRVEAGPQGRAEIGGIVDASSMTGAGGEIAVLGNEVEVFEGALILNDGVTMGGTTRIGGGLRGQDPAFANAENVIVGNGALLSADATGRGNGGQVIVFANDTLVFDGAISARGGSFGGDGGFAELSGKENVQVANLAGRIDLSAPGGSGGTFLYDPTDISILAGSFSPIGGSPVTQNTLYADDIASFLATASLVVTTSSAGADVGNITIAGAASITWNSASTLTFLADNDFVMSPGATITATGTGAFEVQAARSILVGSGAGITTTNGNLTLLANQQVPGSTGTFSGIYVDGGTVRSLGSGNVTLRGRGGTGSNNNYGVHINSGAQVLGGTSGTLLIEGVGGSGPGTIHTGVSVSGTSTLVGSGGANVVIEGYGGSDPGNGFTSGIFITGGSTVSAGGTGSISLYGVGGAGSDYNNAGVFVISPFVGVSTTVATASGDISITGHGGGTASSLGDEGVRLISNNGVTIVSSNGGRITVEGTGGPNASGNLGIDTSASINSGGGAIELVTDRLRIGTHPGSQINSGSGTTTILALSEDFAIQLGSDNAPGSALGITNDELGRINAALVRVGDIGSGPLAVTGAIASARNLALASNYDIAFGQPVTMAADRSLTATAAGTISLGSSVALSASGTGAISLTTARNISLASGSSVTTVNGNLTLSANQQDTATSGSFVGINVSGGLVQSTGTGAVTVLGRGGDDASGTQAGVLAQAGGNLLGGTGGLVTVRGSGGSSSGERNYGVWVTGSGSAIASSGAAVLVEGTGGGISSSSLNWGVIVSNSGSITAGGDAAVNVNGQGGNLTGSGTQNQGVYVSGVGAQIISGGGDVTVHGVGGGGGAGDRNAGVLIFPSGLISAGGMGAVMVTGLGGNTTGTGGANYGVRLNGAGSTISSSGGTVTVHGSGGGADGTTANHGISMISGGMITSGGAGAVQVAGQGGNLGGPGGSNHGVWLSGGGSTITSAGGTVTVEGTGTENSEAIRLESSGSIASGSNAPITLLADSVAFDATATISSGSGTTTLLTRTSSTLIDLGGADVLGGGPLTLGLTDAELDRITAGLLQIGNSASAQITVSNPITHGNHLSLVTGAGVTVNQALNMAADRHLSIAAAGTIELSGSSAALGASGTGSIALATPRNISLSGGSSIATQQGAIALSANTDGTTSGWFSGISLNNASITSTTGAISLNGTPGDLWSEGVGLHNGSLVGSGGGGMTLAGRTITVSASSLTNAGAGTISLQAEESISVWEDSLLTVVDGDLTLVANAGALTGDFAGIFIEGSTLRTTGLGNLSLTGRGGDGFFYEAFGSPGILLTDGAILSSTGTMAGAGSITLHGTGGTGGSGGSGGEDDYGAYYGDGEGYYYYGHSGRAGISMAGQGTRIESAVGAISLTGVGGASEDGGGIGIVIEDEASIRSTGLSPNAASITLHGTGGASGSDNLGVHLGGNGTGLHSANGSILVTGIGGGDGAGEGNHGIGIFGAGIQATGTGAVELRGSGGSGSGGQSGLLLDGGSSISVGGGALTLAGESPNALAPGIQIGLAQLGAGGGVLRIEATGSGAGLALSSTNAAATIGAAGDTLIVESRGGGVSVGGAVRGAILQLRDSSAFGNVDFILENSNNDIDELSAVGTNDSGEIGSLSYRDANGFTVSEYSEMGGIKAAFSVDLRGGSSGTVAVERDVTSSSGNISLSGHDLVVDGATVSTRFSGGISLDAERAILVRGDSLLSVEDGRLELYANAGESPPRPGQFTGITILGSTLSSSGYGNISLTGRGGDGSASPDFSHPGFANPFSAGVRIAGGSVISAIATDSYGGSIRINGTGGGAASDSVGVVIEGAETRVRTADTALSVLGYGGGASAGFRNRGILVEGATLEAGGSGELSLEGWGGQGIGMVDGIELGNGATLQAENGRLRLDGFAGGSLGIGVVATASSGDIRSAGTGTVEIFGSGMGGAGVQLGNFTALLGGPSASSLLVEAEGDLVLGRPASVAGPVTLRALYGEAFVNAAATSTGGNLRVEGFDLTVNAPLSAPMGNLTLKFGDSGSDSLEPSSGVARVNALLAAGGSVEYLGGFGSGDLLTFANYGVSAIDLDFADLSAIENVVGTAFDSDLLRGPAAASLYEFTGPNAFSVGGVAFSSFENVLAGDEDDTFAFSGGGGLSGALDGGGGSNGINYSGFGSPVSVNLSSTPRPSATGIGEGFSNIGVFVGPSTGGSSFAGPAASTAFDITGPNSFAGPGFSASGFANLTGGAGNDSFRLRPGARLDGLLNGGPGTDTLSYALFDRAATVNVGRGTATALGGFSSIERLVGSSFDDTFNFFNQTTLDFVDGGPGRDTLNLDDTNLGGANTYRITSGGIERNPSYRFANVETVRLLLGSGNNTVNSGFYPFTQFLVGGQGFNTLNLPGVDDLSVGSPIGNVNFSGFSAPLAGGTDGPGDDTGGLLKREVDQRTSAGIGPDRNFEVVNRFSTAQQNLLTGQLGALGGAFSAALVAQASVLLVDGVSYLVMRPLSLDGSGLTPSNLAVQRLAEALGVEANLELAAALGLDGGVLLFPVDGAFALDLSGRLVDPALLALLQESLSPAAAAELSSVLGVPLVFLVLAADGIVAISFDGAAPGPQIAVVLAGQLDEAALAELNAALGAGN